MTFFLSLPAVAAYMAGQQAFTLWLVRALPPGCEFWAVENGRLVLGSLLALWVLFLGQVFRPSREGRSGLWTTSLGRRAIGLAAGTALYAAVAGLVLWAEDAAIGSGPVQLAVGALAAYWLRTPAKIALGRTTRGIRRLLRSRYVGLGGTAAFSGLLDEWANPWRPGRVLLGASLYDPRWTVGIKDDRHVISIATSRGGKGRRAILPNLLLWQGSALVIDPKGQNAAVSALARGKGGHGLSQSLGQTVRIIDPLGVIRDKRLTPLVAGLNPLAELDPAATDYIERVDTITEAIVVPNPHARDNFFESSSRAVIAATIDYVRMSPAIGAHERHLGTVRELLIHPDGLPIDEMLEMGGLAQAGAALVARAGKNAAGDVMATAIGHTKWLDSAGMRRTLSASDFSLRDLNDGNTTVYLVLPPQYIDVHEQFLRLFVNLALQAAAEGRKKKHATLYLLDEFYALGRLQQIAKAAGLMAGYGVKLWPIVQNIGQLQELYPQNWEGLMGNAGQWQVFALNDHTTARYLSERLGTRVLWRKLRGENGFRWEISGTANLRDGLELLRDSSRESESVIVFTAAGDAFLLKGAPYDRLFGRDRYMPDPYERGGAS